MPKRAKGNGFTYRFNAQWKPHAGSDVLRDLVEGLPARRHQPAQPTSRRTTRTILTNYELGWKTTLGPGAAGTARVYHQERWSKFQFTFLGANSFTEIHNGHDAEINGVETDLNYRRRAG